MSQMTVFPDTSSAAGGPDAPREKRVRRASFELMSQPNSAEVLHKLTAKVMSEANSEAQSHPRYGKQSGSLWRQTVTRALNEPQSGPVARFLAVFFTCLILSNVCVIILRTVQGLDDSHVDWSPAESVFSYIFTLELLVRCLVQYNRLSEVVRDPFFYVDSISVIPFYISLAGVELPKVIQAVRIIRLLKLSRQFNGSVTLVTAVQESVDALSIPAFFLIVWTVTFGVVVFYIEKAGARLEDMEPAFQNVPETMWFICVTMCTVGYGDLSPVTVLGKGVVIVAILFGVLFIAMPLAVMGNNFCNVWSDRDRVVLIARIRQQLMQGGSSRESVRAAFEVIDLDGSGDINFREFVVAIQNLDIKLSLKSLQKLWRSIDADGSGEIGIDEFTELVFPEMAAEDEDEAQGMGMLGAAGDVDSPFEPGDGDQAPLKGSRLSALMQLKEDGSVHGPEGGAGRLSVLAHNLRRSSDAVDLALQEMNLPPTTENIVDSIQSHLYDSSVEMSEIKAMILELGALLNPQEDGAREQGNRGELPGMVMMSQAEEMRSRTPSRSRTPIMLAGAQAKVQNPLVEEQEMQNEGVGSSE